MRRQRTLLTVVLCLAFSTSHGEAAELSTAQETFTAGDVARFAEQRALRAVNVTYVTTQQREGQPTNASGSRVADHLVPKTETRFLIDLSQQRFLIDERFTQNDGSNAQPVHAAVAWDSTSFVTYRSNQERAFIESKPPTQEVDRTARDRFLFACLLYPPKKDGRGINDGSLISWLRGGSVHKELEEIDGRRCCVVDRNLRDGTLSARAWLDVERSLAPVKLQSFEADGREVGAEWHSQEFVEISGGGRSVWLPTHVDNTIFLNGGAVKVSISLDRDATSINPTISDASFRIELPDGTEVDDAVSKRIYFVGKAPPEPKPKTTWHWGVWANVIVLAVLGLLLFLRRRRRIAAGGVS